MTTKPRTYRETIHMPHGITVEAVATATSNPREYRVTVGGQDKGRANKDDMGGSTGNWYMSDSDGHFHVESTLSDLLRAVAYDQAKVLAFVAEVDAYDGPMDVEDATAECVDCHKEVGIDETITMAPGFEHCPASTSVHSPGHRVAASQVRAWMHQRKVIAAKIASQA